MSETQPPAPQPPHERSDSRTAPQLHHDTDALSAPHNPVDPVHRIDNYGNPTVNGPASHGPFRVCKPGDKIEIAGTTWTIGSWIKDGGSAQVYLANDPTGQPAALKFLTNAQLFEQFTNEFHVALKLGGRWSPKAIGANMELASPVIAYAYVQDKTIQDFVLGDPPGNPNPLEGHELVQFATDLWDAISYFASQDIAHRDISYSNVVVDVHGRPTILDFGAATDRADTVADRRSQAFATLGFSAPELILGEPAGKPADLWGWGAVVLFAATSRIPVPGTLAEQVTALTSKTFKVNLDGVPDELRAALSIALQTEPAKRVRDDIDQALPRRAREAELSKVVKQLENERDQLAPNIETITALEAEIGELNEQLDQARQHLAQRVAERERANQKLNVAADAYRIVQGFLEEAVEQLAGELQEDEPDNDLVAALRQRIQFKIDYLDVARPYLAHCVVEGDTPNRTLDAVMAAYHISVTELIGPNRLLILGIPLIAFYSSEIMANLLKHGRELQLENPDTKIIESLLSEIDQGTESFNHCRQLLSQLTLHRDPVDRNFRKVIEGLEIAQREHDETGDQFERLRSATHALQRYRQGHIEVVDRLEVELDHDFPSDDVCEELRSMSFHLRDELWAAGDELAEWFAEQATPTYQLDAAKDILLDAQSAPTSNTEHPDTTRHEPMASPEEQHDTEPQPPKATQPASKKPAQQSCNVSARDKTTLLINMAAVLVPIPVLAIISPLTDYNALILLASALLSALSSLTLLLRVASPRRRHRAQPALFTFWFVFTAAALGVTTSNMMYTSGLIWNTPERFTQLMSSPIIGKLLIPPKSVGAHIHKASELEPGDCLFTTGRPDRLPVTVRCDWNVHTRVVVQAHYTANRDFLFPNGEAPTSAVPILCPYLEPDVKAQILDNEILGDRDGYYCYRDAP